MILSFMSIFLDIAIFVGVLLVIIGVSSFFIIRDLQTEYKKVFRINSKFEIELRKLVNLLFKFYEHSKLESYTSVVIKQLPHEEKRNLLKIIDEVYQTIDLEAEDNKYIVETYQNLEELRRVRDSKVIVFNQKLTYFPFNIYLKIMKIQNYHTFMDKQ
ncbi:MAG: hypothetical protein RQ856_03325 [Candidatus Izemoplasmatales bacterium]|nr:hypothetical protein [Candidatus Izemoplasmatales bacterium]